MNPGDPAVEIRPQRYFEFSTYVPQFIFFCLRCLRPGPGWTGICRQAQTRVRRKASRARNAFPRWLMLFFSSVVNSAKLRGLPSGWNTGS